MLVVLYVKSKFPEHRKGVVTQEIKEGGMGRVLNRISLCNRLSLW